MIQLSTVGQAVQKTGVKAVIFGASGVGKTVLSATAPTPLILNAEKGLLSLKAENLSRIFGAGHPYVADHHTASVQSIEQIREVYNWLAAKGDQGYFKTIILDSGSEIAEVVLSAAKNKVKDPRQAYGQLQEDMISLLKLFRDLPDRHVVVLAKEEFVKDGNGVFKKMPSMPGNKLGNALPYLFDEVFHLSVMVAQDGKRHRILQTQPSMDCDAKDRSGCLAPVEYADLTYILNKILGV